MTRTKHPKSPHQECSSTIPSEPTKQGNPLNFVAPSFLTSLPPSTTWGPMILYMKSCKNCDLIQIFMWPSCKQRDIFSMNYTDTDVLMVSSVFFSCADPGGLSISLKTHCSGRGKRITLVAIAHVNLLTQWILQLCSWQGPLGKDVEPDQD